MININIEKAVYEKYQSTNNRLEEYLNKEKKIIDYEQKYYDKRKDRNKETTGGYFHCGNYAFAVYYLFNSCN